MQTWRIDKDATPLARDESVSFFLSVDIDFRLHACYTILSATFVSRLLRLAIMFLVYHVIVEFRLII